MDQSERLLQREEAELSLLRPLGPDAMLSWGAKHPASCPMCGRLYSVHEKLGGCPYYYPELEEPMQDLILELEQVMGKIEAMLEEYPDWDLQNEEERFKAEHLSKALDGIDQAIFGLTMIENY